MHSLAFGPDGVRRVRLGHLELIGVAVATKHVHHAGRGVPVAAITVLLEVDPKPRVEKFRTPIPGLTESPAPNPGLTTFSPQTPG